MGMLSLRIVAYNNAASVALLDPLCPSRRVRPVVVICPSVRSVVVVVVVVVRPLSVVSQRWHFVLCGGCRCFWGAGESWHFVLVVYLKLFYAAVGAIFTMRFLSPCLTHCVRPAVSVLCPSVCSVLVTVRLLSVVTSPAHSDRKRGHGFLLLLGGRGLLSSSVVQGRQGLALALVGPFSSLALVPLRRKLALP